MKTTVWRRSCHRHTAKEDRRQNGDAINCVCTGFNTRMSFANAGLASCQATVRARLEATVVVEMLQSLRRQMPRTGGRKLYHQ
ncbi:MAG: hypothetical protein LBD27_03445 [Tannerella sp.]|nr:hypothetical protein [Tannerella sp.]